ncbi:MAG: alpha/beta hydrolase [Pseudomonadota bacterium]
MSVIKRVLKYLLAVLIIASIVMGVWVVIPISVDRASPDPAVVYANARNGEAESYQENYFEFAGQTLHYVEAGQGETVVFLHGFPSFWYSLIRQMDDLKLDHHVVAIDGLGAGRSDAPGEVALYKLEAMTRHLLALIDHLGKQRVHLVGHDWGSGLAFAFAQQYPERVLSVTGIAAAPQSVMLELIRTDARHQEISAYVERFKGANPPLLFTLRVGQRIYDGAYGPLVEAGKLSAEEGELFRNATSDPKRMNAFINWYRANIPAPDEIDDDDFFPTRKAQITPPALFIWGSEDPIVTREAVAQITAASSNLQTLEIEGLGHWPHVHEHARVTAKIRRLIESNSAQRLRP